MSKEKLPMQLKQNQLAITKRANKRLINGFKRVGKIALSAGIAMSGLAITTVGGPVATALGYGFYIGGAVNAGMDVVFKKISKDSMFVQRKLSNGEIKISQSIKDIKSLNKMKGFNKSEKLAMMGLELLVELQSIKQQFEDKGIMTEQNVNGTNDVYPQVYTTTTHGGNIDTIEALENLGYLQIQRKEPKKMSNLFFEKLGFVQNKDEMKELLSAMSKNKLEKAQMYDLALKVTDKPIDFEEIYKSYTQLRGSREKSEESISIKRLGVILEALRNKKIDIVKNDIGETVIDYKSEESFARRMKREQTNPNVEYRKANYIGDTIEQGLVQNQQESLKENIAHKANKENQYEH